MLNHILVRDLAIVSTLELSFNSGMSTLTGETGAGKSILIDALGLALGDKADNNMIRAGCRRAEIIASFDLTTGSQAQDWLRGNALDDTDSCIVRRLLVLDGRSRAFINGRPVALQQIQELGELLVNIHGQGAHQSLLRAKQQRTLLDDYGQHADLAHQVAVLYRRFRDAANRLEELRATTADQAARIDLLRYQVNELTTLNLAEQELSRLDADQRRLRNTSRLRDTCAALLHRLYDADHSVQGELSRANSDLDELLSIDKGLTDSRELLENAVINIQEAVVALREYADGLELDPGRLAEVESRLEQIHDLARKFRVPPERLPDTLKTLREEFAHLASADLEVERLEATVTQLQSAYLEQARELGVQRRATAARLDQAVTSAMQTLGMAGGRFEVETIDLGAGQAGPNGLEKIEFLVSANPGQPLKPLAKVASGGELSRISLAIQVATAACGQIPSLVFDEVDVGIGGGVAEIVGQLLRRLGATHQVLCVTHLPQVAAQAHDHLQVRKYTRNNQTFTAITALPPEERIQEIARMLGGVEITAKTLNYAQEMIDRAQAID